jgi:DHA3 family macrolide efflux protein-like MFS transporter
MMITSPVVAGALLSFSQLESIFFVDVVTAAIAVGLLLLLKVSAHEKAAGAQHTGYLDDLKAGLAYIGRSRAIKTLFVCFAFVFFLVTPAAFLSPLLVARSYGEEVWRLTANEVVFFGGSILGGVIMSVWGGFKNHFRTIGLSCILWAVLFAGLGLTQVFVLYLILMFLSGIPMPFMGAATTTLLQEMVDQDMQGRVFGVQQLIMSTVMPIGMMVFGPVADVITIEVVLVLASALMAVPGLWLFFYNRQRSSAPSGLPSEYEVQPGD